MASHYTRAEQEKITELSTNWIFFHRLGESGFFEGDLIKAVKYLTAALQLAQQLPENDPRRTITLDRLSATCEMRGDFDTSILLLKQSMLIRQRVLGIYTRASVIDYQTIARLCGKQHLWKQSHHAKALADSIERRIADRDRECARNSREGQSQTLPPLPSIIISPQPGAIPVIRELETESLPEKKLIIKARGSI